VDQTCDRFEAAWELAGVSNEPPHLEDYLAAVAEPGRSVLLRELVLLDVYYRLLRRQDATTDSENSYTEQAVHWNLNGAIFARFLWDPCGCILCQRK
jgi:hypothetical protein